MLDLVNGKDAVNYKQLKNLTACFGYPILLRNEWMLGLVNGIDAVSYCRLKNLTACFGYPILLSNGMDAVNSPNPKDASFCFWLSNSVK